MGSWFVPILSAAVRLAARRFAGRPPSAAETRRASSGVSTDSARPATVRTRIGMPFSSARSCSSDSAVSSGVGASSASRSSASRR